MAWKILTDAALAIGQKLTSEKARQLRDNPAAVAAGAVSASGVRIKPHALNTFRISASVNFEFLGRHTATTGTRIVRRYEGGDSGRGAYWENVPIRTSLPPSVVAFASKEADISDTQATIVLQVDPVSTAFTGEFANNEVMSVEAVEWYHTLGRRISRANFTLNLKDDVRESTDTKAVTGTLTYDIIYLRENFWIPDSERPA